MCVVSLRVAMVLGREPSLKPPSGRAVAACPQPLTGVARGPHLPTYGLLMVRIAVTLAAYQALSSTMPEGTARPPEPLEVGEGVGLWIDHNTLAALRRERMPEGWSEVILRLAAG
jgi:hypothetical protein